MAPVAPAAAPARVRTGLLSGPPHQWLRLDPRDPQEEPGMTRPRGWGSVLAVTALLWGLSTSFVSRSERVRQQASRAPAACGQCPLRHVRTAPRLCPHELPSHRGKEGSPGLADPAAGAGSTTPGPVLRVPAHEGAGDGHPEPAGPAPRSPAPPAGLLTRGPGAAPQTRTPAPPAALSGASRPRRGFCVSVVSVDTGCRESSGPRHRAAPSPLATPARGFPGPPRAAGDSQLTSCRRTGLRCKSQLSSRLPQASAVAAGAPFTPAPAGAGWTHLGQVRRLQAPLCWPAVSPLSSPSSWEAGHIPCTSRSGSQEESAPLECPNQGGDGDDSAPNSQVLWPGWGPVACGGETAREDPELSCAPLTSALALGPL